MSCFKRTQHNYHILGKREKEKKQRKCLPAANDEDDIDYDDEEKDDDDDGDDNEKLIKEKSGCLPAGSFGKKVFAQPTWNCEFRFASNHVQEQDFVGFKVKIGYLE